MRGESIVESQEEKGVGRKAQGLGKSQESKGCGAWGNEQMPNGRELLGQVIFGHNII